MPMEQRCTKTFTTLSNRWGSKSGAALTISYILLFSSFSHRYLCHHHPSISVTTTLLSLSLSHSYLCHYHTSTFVNITPCLCRDHTHILVIGAFPYLLLLHSYLFITWLLSLSLSPSYISLIIALLSLSVSYFFLCHYHTLNFVIITLLSLSLSHSYRCYYNPFCHYHSAIFVIIVFRVLSL